MALITNQNTYIKLTATLEEDKINVDNFIYPNKEEREKEKAYQPLIENLLVNIKNKLKELYADMMTEAERIGYTEADWQDMQGTDNYVSQHPSFKIKYDAYHKLYKELYDIQLYIGLYTNTLDSNLEATKEYFGGNVEDIVINSKIKKNRSSFPIRELPKEDIDITEYAYNKVKKLGLFGETIDV